MTGNNDKLRSLFLTALMVMSVFAMTVSLSGAAAAANSEASVDSAVEYTEDGNTVIEVVLDQSTDEFAGGATANGTNAFVEGADGTVTDIRQVGETGVAFNLTEDLTPNQEVDVTLYNGDTNITTVEDITITATSVEENGGDASVYQGEPIGIVAADTGTTFTVSGGGDTITASTGSDSKVARLNTDNLDSGQEYEVDFQDGGATNFSVSNLGLSVSADDVEVGDDIEAEIDTNRAGDVEVELLDGSTVVNSTTVDADALDTTTANLGSVEDTGNYDINATDANTGVTESTSLNVSEETDDQAQFSQGVVQQHVGDVASIPIELQDTEEVTVAIGNEDNNGYVAIANVTDDSGDGEVVLEFNTYTAGSSADVVDVEDSDDNVELMNQTEFDSNADDALLDTGNYNMNVSVGHGDVSDATDQGTLSLQERSTEALTVWTAPASEDASNWDADEFWSEVGNSLTETDTITQYDDAVLAVEATGIEGAVDENDANLTLEISHLNPGMNQNENDLVVGSDNLTSVPDAANDTYFLVLDTNNIDQYEEGNEYEANFSVNASSVLASDGAESVYAEYEYAEEDASLNTEERDGDDLVVVQNDGNQTVTGETNLAAGTEVTVHMSSQDDESPFLITPETTVQEDGTFNATTDEFSDVGLGANFTAIVRAEGDDISDEYDGRVLEAQEEDNETTPTPTPDESTPTPDESSPTPDEGGDETPTEEEGPGFGVAVGLIALIGAALLAARRQN